MQIRSFYSAMITGHHWLRRGRVARFFIEVLASMSNRDDDPVIKFVAHLREIERGALRLRRWDGYTIWNHPAIEQAVDFAHSFVDAQNKPDFRPFGSIGEFLSFRPSGAILAPHVSDERYKHAAIEAVTLDVMDGNDQPETASAIRALLSVGQHDRALSFADQRLPRPMPTFTWDPQHGARGFVPSKKRSR